MLVLGMWLLVVGFCDLLRAVRDATSPVRRALIVGVGLALLALLLGSTGTRPGIWAVLMLALGSAFAMWVLGSAVALQSADARRVAIGRVVAFLGLGGGLTGASLVGRSLDTGRAWPDLVERTLLGSFAPGSLFLVLGVVAVQLATANVVVRLVLDAVGVPAVPNEKQLKGGRLLGPMERLFIVGLGAAGAITAAAIVVAAKGLLRFPELQRGIEERGPSDVTEYFLIGSFASWLVAIGGLGLLWLGVPAPAAGWLLP